ncbi:beta-propeller domain-containing protein [Nocardioides sp. zg-1228]|uniref:beta-propeller domain-containing protein n=1 Tax=Nocardioides sp. zg-1228 TaxID=2763008 RepID=UPI001642D6D0|nr:beta-propeller domain-containing protein [Nocardioides sp. zg-1228]MBC2931597.1 beta-propeller domain-containing protein [Nocardioides sp. zg-1228]QSF57192.1 beta-propeller domain-containing protein [Nocardioides sp. zg-1228]
MRARRIVTSLTVVTSLAAALGIGYALGDDPGARPPAAPPITLANADLTVASSCADLLDSYVERALAEVGPYGWGDTVYSEAMSGADAAAPADAAESARSTVSTSRSTSAESGTNVQEAGVDESDVVKVAGSLLVRLREGELLAYDVSGEEPSLLSATRLDDARGSNGWVGDPGGELLLVDGRAVVVGTSAGASSTTITTVDLADPTAPAVVDATTVGGRASAVRLHGDVVRVVVHNSLPQLDFAMPEGTLGELRARMRNRALVRDTTLADWLPTVAGDPVVDCADVAVPEDSEVAVGTTTVLALDPADPTALTTDAVATDSDISYFSTDRFYLAAASPQWGWIDCMDCRPGGMPMPDGTTPLFAFALEGTDTTYVASGEVEGTIADRWSMDAVGGSLRVALGPSSETGDFNSVVILREEGADLVEDGRVDGLGVGEEIKSVRWFDDLAIVVTFRQTDPLYAVDLSDATEPRLLGELKIPGFSDYLHPLGERRLIGMGQDASLRGVTRGAQAALFDVTDLADPRQIDVVRYDDGTWAAAGGDPRQFAWLPDRRVALTVVSRSGRVGMTGWVSVLSLADGSMDNRMVEVEHGTDVDAVRLVPLASGEVVLVTGDDVTFFDL